MSDSYERWLRDKIEHILPGAWEDPGLVAKAPVDVGDRILERVLGLCDAQNVRNHAVALEFSRRLPREWFLANVERVAEDVLDLDDEWHFRRFRELAQEIDAGLDERLAERGRRSTNPEVAEAACEHS